MQTANDNQKFKFDNPTWYLIADYSLSEAASGEDMAAELTAGLLFQTMRGLGIPPECLKRIEGTITEIARGTRALFNHSLPDLPVRISLFYTKKLTDSVCNSIDQLNGGWGYYVIEKSMDLPEVSCEECHRVVELYLYREGE